VRWLGVGAVECGSGYVYHAMKVGIIVESRPFQQISLFLSTVILSLPNRRTVFTIIFHLLYVRFVHTAERIPFFPT
jgi:hypothetical protein